MSPINVLKSQSKAQTLQIACFNYCGVTFIHKQISHFLDELHVFACMRLDIFCTEKPLKINVL